MKRGFEKILIAVDHSEPSAHAVRVGCSMAASMDATVLLVHVTNRLPFETSESQHKLMADLRRRGRGLLRRMQALAEKTVVAETVLREGVPADEILAAAERWSAQLIVLGAHGQSRLGHLVLGGTAETVARRARCPVVTVGANAQTMDDVYQDA